jgi:ABC-type transport system involved in cytochrome bd biosynthesis fused ATPase/permease subunit
MKTQNYKNHTRIHPLYHYILSLLILVTLIAAITNMVLAINERTNILQAVILVLIMIIIIIVAVLVRTYALKAQDRAIRAEERLRYYVLTGELLDSALSMGQIAALRFAGDNEFADLCKKAAVKGLKPDDIKKAIKNWRADNNRI